MTARLLTSALVALSIPAVHATDLTTHRAQDAGLPDVERTLSLLLATMEHQDGGGAGGEAGAEAPTPRSSA